MKKGKFSILIGGEAGAGIARAGFLFAKTCMRRGFHVFGTNDYQSRIRGGHNFYVVTVDDENVHSQTDYINLLIALNAETIALHTDDLVPDGGIIYDKDDVTLNHDTFNRTGLKLYPIPLKKIAREELKQPLLIRNTVALGAVVALLDYNLTLLEEVLRDTFKEEVAESNVKASQVGYKYAKENFKNDSKYHLSKAQNLGKRQIFLSGNEAVGLGAISAGCKFYAAYPMTPSTGVLHFLAANKRKYNMIVMQPEGEIAAINMVTGAAFSGTRAMTATSGGGFCLMSEGVGMAGMTETPVVIMVAQRPGPSTGLPTYSSQGDLRFIIHASQGEFPRVVIAPGDVEECFYETARAFNWAEKYQLPVILLTDKYLVESQMSLDPFNSDSVEIEQGPLIRKEYRGEEEYKRHRLTVTGVSPRAIPMTKGAIIRTSANEHDERGYTTEDPNLTTQMMDKRMRKLSYLAKELKERNIDSTKFYGPKEAEATIISWGSTKGPIIEAIKLLKQQDNAVNCLQILYLQPFPAEVVEKTVNEAKISIVIENNKTSHLSRLMREYIMKDADQKILKYDGRPFNPGDICQRIKEVL